MSQQHTVDILRTSLHRMILMHEMMMAKVNHGASAYDADCIREMNEAPIQAKRAIEASRLEGFNGDDSSD